MYYSDETVEEVRERNDIVEVISSYVKLEKKGANYFGLCPFHNEKTPSFSVSPDRQMYYCFGCGAGGNVISFIMQYENYTFKEALKMLADRCGMKLPDVNESENNRKKASLKQKLLEIHKISANFYYRQLKDPSGEQAYKYLKDRGLSDPTILHFGLGFSGKKSALLYRFLKSKGYDDDILKETGLVTIEEKGAHDKFFNRVIFPIMDAANRVIGFGGRVMGDGLPKYLNSPETTIFDKSRNLYGFNFARTSRKEYMILCEGYMDVIALHQAGFVNSAASLGTSLTSEQCVILKRCVSDVILSYDSDEAGVKAANRAVTLLKEAGIRSKVLNMKPYKDPDEFIKNLGKDAYEDRIRNAKNAFLWQIDIIKQKYNLDDPDEKTAFLKDIALKLTSFDESIERENYMQAVARDQMISYEDLKKLVNQLGNTALIKRTRKEEQKKDRTYLPGKKRDSDEDIKKSERILLFWLSDDTKIIEKVKKYIEPDDFLDPINRDIAKRMYEGQSPASILNAYTQEDEDERKAAQIFQNTGIFDEAEKQKAIADCVRKIKLASLERQALEIKDLSALQAVIKEQARIKTEHLNLG